MLPLSILVVVGCAVVQVSAAKAAAMPVPKEQAAAMSLRDTRDCRRVYATLNKQGAEEALKAANEGKEGFELIEITRKTRKTHRNIVRMETAFLR